MTRAERIAADAQQQQDRVVEAQRAKLLASARVEDGESDAQRDHKDSVGKWTRVKSDWRRLKQSFFEYLAGSAAKYCLKPTGEQAGIGLRRENFGFPESKKLKP